MTSEPTNSPQPPQEPRDDAGHESPTTAAAERWAHGLLEFLHRDTPLEQERRVSRVMEAVNAPADSRWKLNPRVLRFVAAAAIVVFSAGLFSILFHSGNTALATVRSAVAAVRNAGVSRYQISVTPNTGDERPNGTLDTKDGKLFVLMHRTPQGHMLIAGRDEQGEWTIRPDGQVDRQNPRSGWPMWAFLTDSTVVVGSMSDILAELEDQYDLAITDESPEDSPPESTGMAMRHVHASAPRSGPLPSVVDVWVDDSTKLVQRMDLRWNLPRRGEPGGPMQGPGPGQGPGPDRRPGPRGERPDGPPGDRADGPPPRRGPGGGPPHERGEFPPLGPDGLPPPPPDLFDGPRPDGPGPGGPRPDGPPPRRFDGPRPDGPRADGPRPDGPKGDGPRRPPGPPRMIRFQRQSTPTTLPENWFSPEAHRE